MEVQTDYKSVLNLIELKITDADFHLDEGGIKEAEIDIDITRNIEVVEEDVFKVVLVVKLQNEDMTLETTVKCVGLFQTDSENTTLIERNTISIMFPYIRSYISLLTTQPGMQPIVLPPINIMALLADLEK